MAEKEAYNYLVDFGAWDFEPEECFPCGKILTGKWYIGTIFLFLDNNKQIRGSIEMRFTLYDKSSTVSVIANDYLGMKCWFHYYTKTKTFIFDCSDTSVI